MRTHDKHGKLLGQGDGVWIYGKVISVNRGGMLRVAVEANEVIHPEQGKATVVLNGKHVEKVESGKS